jgi:hypothetical protein
LKGVRSSYPCVFGGIIINDLFIPFSTRGRASGTPQNWIFLQKSLKKQSKLLFSKNISEIKKIPDVILVDYIIFPGKLYCSFF